ncbi:MAG TPA: hypothetical protein VIM62_06920 [Acidobacteriaceae bacterium]
MAAVSLISAAFMAGCHQTPAPAPASKVTPVVQKQIKEAPPTPIAEKKAELGAEPGTETWDPAWDRIVEEALPADMVFSSRAAHDAQPFCPRFAHLSPGDRRAFWAYFFQALAGAEAGLKPTTNVRHTEPEVAVRDDVTRRMVRSEGLLQLTYMDSKRYDCEFDWDADKQLKEHDPQKTILQPKNNLECGVKILHNQLMDQHRPLLSAKSYWSTLQPGTVSYRVFRKQMANVPQVCRVAPQKKADADRELAQAQKVKPPARGSAGGVQ